MDRLIWTAWRAFWVGLGASTVLIAQSVLASPPEASMSPAEVPSVEPAVTAPARPMGAEPIRSRTPFDATRGKSIARIRNAS